MGIIHQAENQLGLDKMVQSLSKLRIKCHPDDNPGGEVVCSYNPKEVSFQKGVNWSPDAQGVATNFPALQFTGGNAIKCTAELFIEGYEKKQDVRGPVKTLISFCLKHPQANPRDIRPPRVKLIWGAQEILDGASFQNAVITDVQVHYTMFLPDGTPCRAKASVSMQEADVVSSGGGADGSEKLVTFSSNTEIANYPGATEAADKAGYDVIDGRGSVTLSIPSSGNSGTNGDD